MKLYYAPSACSLASHIVLRELQLPFELVRVDIRAKRTAEGDDFLAINPKGYVAALTLDDGQVLTEVPALLQYLADLRPEAGLAPPAGSWERVRLQELLSFLASEIHTGGCALLFNPRVPEDAKPFFRERLGMRLDGIAADLDGRDYLLGERFGVADAFFFTMLRWLPHLGLDLARWPVFGAYMARIEPRPAVRDALAAEAA
ncbi:glutathione transferase GstA [Pseudomonas mangiferae]|uniref:Glutathione transferase GstA n=1 Tax=Pseudomonas mangiferae TaxID=2593654 RepID=A0A553GTH2_9PSED|nr:glutathione transferase GstA [Pseudomonas mangiferae]TRX72770.1 glutathione transferase GstA [Pseudomonas mangiferae]